MVLSVSIPLERTCNWQNSFVWTGVINITFVADTHTYIYTHKKEKLTHAHIMPKGLQTSLALCCIVNGAFAAFYEVQIKKFPIKIAIDM